MRQIRFALYFALGLFLVSLCTIVLLMVQAAPLRANLPFMGVAIDPATSADSIVFLPNRLFRCAEQGQQIQCQATLENQPLQITFDYSPNAIGGLSNCRAVYAGRAISCQPGGGTVMTPQGHLGYYFLNGIRLTVDQLRSLQRQFWLVNLIGTGKESIIGAVTLGMPTIAAALAIGLNWLEENWLTRIFTSLSGGFLLAMLVQSFLGHIPFAMLAQYGIDSAAYWQFVLPLSMSAVGTVGTVVTGLYVSRRTGFLIRAAMNLLMGLSAAAFVWFLFPLLGLLSNLQAFWLMRIPLALIVGVGSMVWLWQNQRRSVKFFSCIMSALGAFTTLLLLLLRLSLNLGFAD